MTKVKNIIKAICIMYVRLIQHSNSNSYSKQIFAEEKSLEQKLKLQLFLSWNDADFHFNISKSKYYKEIILYFTVCAINIQQKY